MGKMSDAPDSQSNYYLNFLKAWKKAAQRSAKKGDDWGCLTGTHMFLYKVLRGHNVYDAFTPITRETKLRNGFYVYHGMYWAYDNLTRIGRFAQRPSEWSDRYVNEFLAPFNGTIDKDRLIAIVEALPTLSPVRPELKEAA